MNALPQRTEAYRKGGAKEGRRHDELLAAACQLRDAGATRQECSELIDRAIKDGLTETHAVKVVDSVYARPKREPIVTRSANGEVKLSPEDKERIAANERRAAVKRNALRSKSFILANMSRSPEVYYELSPQRLYDLPHDDWRLLLELFQPDDVLWIGPDTQASANEKHDPEWIEQCRLFFRPVSDWLSEPAAPGLFTCPSVFKTGSYSRSNANVVTRRFLVVESDELDKQQVCAVFHWLEQFTVLRAIVDTAGKSLHGWFNVPCDKFLAELEIVLPAWGCDSSLFKPSQPCRLPGALRNGKFQSLLYLNPKGFQQ